MRAGIPLLFATVFIACTEQAPTQGESQLTSAQTDLSRRLDSVLTSAVGDHYGASVLIAVNDTVILSKGFGYIDSAHRYKPADTTLFNVASITKSFTAMSILQLAQEGRLDVDDSLATFFPDLPADKRGITLAQCILHTSGLGQRYVSDGLRTREEAVLAIGKDTLQSAPGKDFNYSNENYELLGAVIEMVTGSTYEAYVQERILRPSGMTHTLFWRDVGPIEAPRFAEGQLPAALGNQRDWGYVGSGGLFLCMRDLHGWFQALNSGRSIPVALRDSLWTPRFELSVGQMAYGWFISKTNGTKEIWTRGTESWGHNAVLRWFPEHKLLIIVLTNSGEIGDRSSTGNRILSDALVDLLIPR